MFFLPLTTFCYKLPEVVDKAGTASNVIRGKTFQL